MNRRNIALAIARLSDADKLLGEVGTDNIPQEYKQLIRGVYKLFDEAEAKLVLLYDYAGKECKKCGK